jgi:hypothetical protein
VSSDLRSLAPLRNEPEKRNCYRCERPLTVRDTRSHEILTAAGPRTVVEVTLRCAGHRRTIVPPSPLTPPKSPFAFDLVAEAGVLRFLHHRQLQEIQEEFHRQGLPRLPLRTVQRLTDRFTLYHAAVHLESLPRLREALRKRGGGYVLVLDGTGEAGRMTLELTDDDESGGTGWTLLAAPIPKEEREEIRPFLERLRKDLGPPLSGISDQSDGLRKAFRAVFPGVYLLLCHYHVLRSIGESLAGTRYGRFKVEVDRSGVKGRLNRFVRRLRKERGNSREARQTLAWAEEILSSGKAARGRAYPFFWEALEFYRRCARVRDGLRSVLSRPGRRGKGAPYRRLEAILGRLSPPPKARARLVQDFPVLAERWQWLERTRRVLGYRNGPVPLSPEGKLSERGLERGRRRLDWMLGMIEEETGRKSRSPLVRELHRQLERVGEKLRLHREELFAPNVAVRVNGRRRVRRLHRSNGAAERQFRRLRRHGRRVTANRDVEGVVSREGPGMLLVSNLQDARYVREVYGSRSHVGERFAMVSPEALAEAKLLLTRSAGLPSGRKACGQQ